MDKIEQFKADVASGKYDDLTREEFNQMVIHMLRMTQMKPAKVAYLIQLAWAIQEGTDPEELVTMVDWAESLAALLRM